MHITCTFARSPELSSSAFMCSMTRSRMPLLVQDLRKPVCTRGVRPRTLRAGGCAACMNCTQRRRSVVRASSVRHRSSAIRGQV